jgi:ornithine carbamoyltransferase
VLPPRHFLDIEAVGLKSLQDILALTRRFKKQPSEDDKTRLAGRSVVLLFEKQSTRTRLSFDVAITQLGGHPITLHVHDTQLGRGETIADTARTFSRYVDAVMLRTTNHTRLLEFSEHATIPVINGLTDHSHPCQVMADVLTLEEKTGAIAGQTVAWVGDANNVCYSWMQAARLFGFTLRLSCPKELAPKPDVLDDFSKAVTYMPNPEEAVEEADCVVTDTWVSMGQNDVERRRFLLAPYQVTNSLMALAKPNAIFQHCLPATRGQEVTANVLDGHQSVVWEEAENRLHVQKAILCWCLQR